MKMVDVLKTIDELKAEPIETRKQAFGEYHPKYSDTVTDYCLMLLLDLNDSDDIPVDRVFTWNVDSKEMKMLDKLYEEIVERQD